MNAIALIAALAFAAAAWFWLKRQYRAKGRAHFAYLLLFALALVAVALAATGKLHWVGAIVAASATALFRVGMLAIRFLLPRLGWLGLLRRYWQSHRQGPPGDGRRARAGEPIDRSAALEILGLDEGASREEIVRAHRQLIQKLHPDRGGNDYLASRINRAKDLLLDS